jgi:hypothetical protein
LALRISFLRSLFHILQQQASIDLDQHIITEELAKQTADGFQEARTIYSLHIQPLSSDGEDMRDTNGEFFPYFQWFIDYYGQSNYADDFIVAAFDGGATISGMTGNFDFSLYTLSGRAEAVDRSTVFLSIAMYVIRYLEVAIQECLGCTDASAGCGASSLDNAVALYVGSFEGTDGSGSGLLMYAEADTLCQRFKTCGEQGNSGSGTSKVNLNVMREFTSMQQNLLSWQCNAATANKDTIARQMFVPFVQGSLRSAYLLDAGNRSETTKAEGTIYAAAVLPVVYSCNQNDAEVIYDNMLPGATASFAAVEAAFQENYDCMGIACEDVGGLWDDATGQYFDGAGPCGVV